jgi:hypothetical protein
VLPSSGVAKGKSRSLLDRYSLTEVKMWTSTIHSIEIFDLSAGRI